MRKAFRHSGVLMMVAVVALGLLGAAYTLWYEDLILKATVSTGTFNADVSIHDLNESDENQNGLPVVATPTVTSTTDGVATLLGENYGAFLNSNFLTGKPKPFCNGTIDTNSTDAHANDATDTNELTLTMSGLYPYAGCEFTIDVHNSGTIPFHLALIARSLEACSDGNDADDIPGNQAGDCGPATAPPWSIGLDPDQGNLEQCAAFLGGVYLGPLNTIVQYDPDGAGPLTATPVQVHTELACTFKLILDQDANAENKLYKFSAEWRAFQWNETPTGNALNTP